MNRISAALLACIAFSPPVIPAERATSADRATVRSASPVQVPLKVDGNSPTFWLNGKFHYITSTGDSPTKARGADQFNLVPDGDIHVEPSVHYPIWIEGVWVDEDGIIYGWYHHEPRGLCPDNGLTAPVIGAVVSYDGGSIYHDLGIVLKSSDPMDCTARNGFFGSGHGDFSVILDQDRQFFYFLFTNYGGDVSHQGIVTARLAFEDRKAPAGAVWKYHNGEWAEPGIGGQVTPILPTRVAWRNANADSFWGPAVHWNTYLQTYVVLLNRACCEPGWPQAGIHFTTNPDLAHPEKWIKPELILEGAGVGFYPQVIGIGEGETDTLAGEVVRLYVHGKSEWEILFSKFHRTDPDPVDPPDPTEEVRAAKRTANSPAAPHGLTNRGRLKPSIRY